MDAILSAQRYLVVHPQLHGSGFGNQMGMLLQHVALAAFSGRTLVLPPVHQPREHQQRRRGEVLSFSADAVFNLSTLAPLARVLSLRQTQLVPDTARLTFSAGMGGRRPLRMPPVPVPPLVAAARMLSQHVVREEDGGSDGVRHISYCHLPSCRTRTKRACRRLANGCARSAQRLPNNYLFAHRLGPLLCGGNGSSTASHSSPGGASSSADAIESTLLAYQRDALSRLALSDELRAKAVGYAKLLGNSFFAVHARLRDVTTAESARAAASAAAAAAAAGEYNKGVSSADLPRLLVSLLRTLHANATTKTAGDEVTMLYVASNRPATVREVLPAIATAMGRAGFGHVLLRSWNDLALDPAQPSTAQLGDPTGHGGPTGGDDGRLDGLRAALVEHELCTLAPRGFAGSPFSTWANLIGARRLLGGHPADRAYRDLHSGAVVPACAAHEHHEG